MGRASNGCGIDFVILGVSSDKPDENNPAVVVDFDDEPVVVAFDVEDNPVSGEDVRARVEFFDVLRPAPIRRLGFMEPRFERCFGAGVFFIKIPECFPCDDSHLNLKRAGQAASTKFPVWELKTSFLSPRRRTVGRFFHLKGGLSGEGGGNLAKEG